MYELIYHLLRNAILVGEDGQIVTSKEQAIKEIKEEKYVFLKVPIHDAKTLKGVMREIKTRIS